MVSVELGLCAEVGALWERQPAARGLAITAGVSAERAQLADQRGCAPCLRSHSASHGAGWSRIAAAVSAPKPNRPFVASSIGIEDFEFGWGDRLASVRWTPRHHARKVEAHAGRSGSGCSPSCRATTWGRSRVETILPSDHREP